jgi:hypothetical protein
MKATKVFHYRPFVFGNLVKKPLHVGAYPQHKGAMAISRKRQY